MNTEPAGVKLNWMILCENVSVDNKTNNVSIFNVVEEIKLDINVKESDKNSEIIFLPIKQKLISFWFNDNPTGMPNIKARLQFFDPGKKLLQETPLEINFEDGKKRLRFIIDLNGLMVTTSGQYTFSMVLENSGMFIRAGVTDVEIDVHKNIEP